MFKPSQIDRDIMINMQGVVTEINPATLRYNPFFVRSGIIGEGIRVFEDMWSALVPQVRLIQKAASSGQTSEQQIYTNNADVVIASVGSTAIGTSDEFSTLFTAFPLMPTAAGMIEWATSPTGSAILNEFFDSHGCVGFPVIATPPSIFMWSRDKVIEDKSWFSGKVGRSYGYQGRIFQTWGATTPYVPPSETAAYLSSNQIDFAEYLDPTTDTDVLGSQLSSFYAHGPGLHEQANIFYLIIRKPVWNLFGSRIKKRIMAVIDTTLRATLTYGMRSNVSILTSLASTQHFVPISATLKTQFTEEWYKYVQQKYTSDVKWARVYTSIMEYQGMRLVYQRALFKPENVGLDPSPSGRVYPLRNVENVSSTFETNVSPTSIAGLAWRSGTFFDIVTKDGNEPHSVVTVSISAVRGALLNALQNAVPGLLGVMTLYDGTFCFVYDTEQINNTVATYASLPPATKGIPLEQGRNVRAFRINVGVNNITPLLSQIRNAEINLLSVRMTPTETIFVVVIALSNKLRDLLEENNLSFEMLEGIVAISPMTDDTASNLFTSPSIPSNTRLVMFGEDSECCVFA